MYYNKVFQGINKLHLRNWYQNEKSSFPNLSNSKTTSADALKADKRYYRFFIVPIAWIEKVVMGKWFFSTHSFILVTVNYFILSSSLVIENREKCFHAFPKSKVIVNILS